MIGRSKASGGRAMGFLGFVALADLLFALSAGLLLLNTTAAPAPPQPLPPPAVAFDAHVADEGRLRVAWEEEQQRIEAALQLAEQQLQRINKDLDRIERFARDVMGELQ